MQQSLRTWPRLLGTWLTFLLLLAGYDSRAQAWDMAQAVGTSDLNGQATGYSTIADGTGGLYVTGSFQGVISLGGRTLRSDEYTSFIAKLQAGTGTCQWIIAGPGGADLAVDAAGDLYVAGSFGGRTLTLGATTLTNTCSNTYGSDLFVAKLSSGGQWLWAHQASGPGSKYASRLALDAGGSVYLTGNFGTSATFGSTTLTSASNEVFVAKISAAGQWQWAVKGGSEKANSTNGLQADASGNVYVTGSFRGVTATFGSFSVTNSSSVAGSGLPDVFVAKLNAAGQWQWVTKAGGYNSDYTVGLGLDAAGNVYVAGLTEVGLVTFGSISLNVPYESRVFVAKLNNSGQWQWVTPAGGTGQDRPSALVVDAAGNTFLTGNFTSPRMALGSISLDKPGQQTGVFAAKINSSGQWQWAAQNSGTENVSSNGLTLDTGGNVFLTGHYSLSCTSFGPTTLSSSGTISPDLFVARLNGSGQWQWAVQSNGGGESAVQATATDAAGNVYVAGTFTGTLAFGPTTLSSQAGNSVFVAKRSAAGQWLWVTSTTGSARYGTGEYFDKSSLAVDGSGNVYLAGSFRGSSATFGSSVLSSNTGGHYGYDAFVAKLNTSGQWQWAVKGGGNDDDSGSSVAVDVSGRVYVAGHFQSVTATFGGFSVTSPTPGNRNQEVFVARLDADGQWQWASSGGGSNTDFGTGLALDAAGNVYIAGSYQTAATFGPSTLSSPGYSSAYVAKLNAAGQWQWATGAEGSGYYGAAGIATDASGNAYITGFGSGEVAFGSITLSSTDSADVYVAKVNSTGQWQWATLGGLRGSNEGMAIAVDASGSAYVSGIFRSAGAIFGSTVLPYSKRSYYDTFVAQLTPAGQWQWATSVAGVGVIQTLALDNVGNLYLGGRFGGIYGAKQATFGALSLTSPAAVHSVGYLARLNPTITASYTAVNTRRLAQAFPNPFAHQLTVQLLAPLPGVVEVTAHDVTGRQWLREQVTLPAGQTTLPLPAAARWPAGVYTLTVRQGTHQQVLKVVRQ